MREVKQIDIKNRTCWFYNDKINIKDFNASCQRLTKNHLKVLVFTRLDTSQLKRLIIVKIFIV